MRCFVCKGVWHPASGDYNRQFGVATCGPCRRAFLVWSKGHIRRKWGGQDFYVAAATSIRAA